MAKGITVKKAENFSEWYSQVCLEEGAQLVDLRYGVQGFVVTRPWAFKILRKIYELFEKEVEDDGHEPFLFPTIIPESSLAKEKEHAGFTPEVFWITKDMNEGFVESPIALRPTGETQIYPMYSLWVRSHNDLPFKGYQSRITVFRKEKTTRPFLRGREFLFFETHDVFASPEDAMEQVKKDMKMMHEVVHEKLSLPFIFFKRPEWDKFLGAQFTYASDTLTPDGKRLQISSTHDLGTNFSKAYDIKFMDKDGIEKHAWQTCFGPGIFRIMAALIAIHGDDKGLVLPSIAAPLEVVIIPITFSKKEEDNKKVLEKCEAVEKKLKKDGFRVKVDVSHNSPGFKFNQWEMMGVPVRLEIGPQEIENDLVVLVRRTSKDKQKIKLAGLSHEIKENLTLLDNEIRERALEYFKDNTRDANTMKKVVAAVKDFRGFVKAPWCHIDNKGAHCAKRLKEQSEGGVVCGVPFEDSEKLKAGERCVVCGEVAHHIVYIMKSY